MATNTAKYVAVQDRLEFVFRTTAEAAQPFYPSICTEIASTRSDQNYGFLGAMPGVREWVGDRIFEEVRAGKFTIANKLWESSLSVAKTDINDDVMGLYGPLMQDLANEAMYHPDQLFFEAIVAGESTACFDGQYFFDTDHSWGDSGTQSNDLTYAAATGTTPTAAEFRLAFHAARVAMLQFKNDRGKLLNRQANMRLSSLMCVVPAEMHLTALEALDAPVNSYGATNVVIDRPVIVSDARLTDASKFYLFNLDGAMKPFVFQKREPLTLGWKGADDLETKDLKCMTQARYNVGYFAWWKAALTTFT